MLNRFKRPIESRLSMFNIVMKLNMIFSTKEDNILNPQQQPQQKQQQKQQ